MGIKLAETEREEKETLYIILTKYICASNFIDTNTYLISTMLPVPFLFESMSLMISSVMVGAVNNNFPILDL